MTARPPYSYVDTLGRTFVISGANDCTHVQVTVPVMRAGRATVRTNSVELDPTTAVAVAHELLERACAAGADCDEIAAAVEALRELAGRDPACEHPEVIVDDDTGYEVCASCSAIVRNPVGSPF